MNLEPKKEEPIYTIGIAAKRLSLSVSTLRMYEREGLLLPYKTDTKRRVYSQSDLEWISCIKKLIKEKGLNIEGIRRLLALMPCWQMKSCPIEGKDECSAYLDDAKPCWVVKTSNGNKAAELCRNCVVYQSADRCEQLKKMFKEMNVR